MNITPMSFADSLRIGSVEFVSPDEIKVILEIDSPDSVALNTGTPRSFPRVNSYVLIPNEMGSLVAQVEWITVERSQFPKRRGMQDFGLIDLPFPLKKMSLNPLGKLFFDENNKFKFQRGIDVFPTIGDPVILPTDTQLKAIVESGQKNRVEIGTSPLAANAKVFIDPDRLFGRHLAVLGNTGSGKSCSVAGLIRWSLDAASKEIAENNEKRTNSRFIILDPNGEYSKAFSSYKGKKILSVEPEDNISDQLIVPYWFWSVDEWSTFVQASSKTQKPVLTNALRSVKDGAIASQDTPSHEMRRFLRTIYNIVKIEKHSGRPWSDFPHPKNFLEKIVKWRDDSLLANQLFSADELTALETLRSKITNFSSARTGRYPQYDFSKPEIDELLVLISEAHHKFGGSDSDCIAMDANIPKQFDGDELLRSVEAHSELMNVTDYVETMVMRIRTMVADKKIASMNGDESVTLNQWLDDYIGKSDSSNLHIIDLSLVPQEVVHIITAVITRMILEALQRYQKANRKSLPTVLVMDEAHNFVKRYNNDAENQDAASICCKVFEKVAREGRKFGLGMVLASQRPSELSPTVLSQCNSFLLHRLSNDRDQEIVHKLVPDNLKGLLRDLPNLPSKMAILLGWASELPILVQMKNLIDEHKPKSDDPDFWDVWTRKDERNVNWHEIANQWQQIPIGQENTGLDNEAE